MNKEEKKKIPFKLIFSYFWKQIRIYKFNFWMAFILFGAATALANVVVPLVYKNIIDTVSLGEVSDVVVGDLMSLIIVLALFVVSYSFLYRIADYSYIRTETRVSRDLANYTYKKLTLHSQRFFADNFSGSLIAKANRFVSSFAMIQDIIVFNFWTSGIILVGAVLVLFSLAPILGVILFSWLIVAITTIVFLVRHKIKYDLAAAEADSRVTGKFSDVITNILNIKAFSSRKWELENYKKVTSEEEKVTRKAFDFGNFISLIQDILIGILEVGGMYVAIKLWIAGTISAGTVFLVQVYIAKIFNIVWSIGRSLGRLSTAFSNATEMVAIFEEEPDILDIKNPEVCRIKKGEIEFEKVSFKYKEENYILNDLNLHIKPGEKIGLVGQSGAGKSTISKILLRFADLNAGKITIDGQDISKITQDDLRRAISYVSQDSLLFHRTLRENIMYGKQDASTNEMTIATKRAQAHDFILAFPKGYETEVGERGVKLSGGERQRVAIARAILKDAPILILDEATSSLDSVSESKIQKALDELMKGKTSIVIAHRLSTIQKMDRIIVLDRGGIIEEGTHKELIGNNGVYTELWKHQTTGFIE